MGEIQNGCDGSTENRVNLSESDKGDANIGSDTEVGVLPIVI